MLLLPFNNGEYGDGYGGPLQCLLCIFHELHDIISVNEFKGFIYECTTKAFLECHYTFLGIVMMEHFAAQAYFVR